MRKLLLLLFFTLSLFADVRLLDIEAFEALRQQGVPVIDIRTEPEWRQTGIVPGSQTVTFFRPDGSYDLQGFLGKLKALGITKETPFVLVCRTAHRTHMLGQFLSQKLGYKKVYELAGGIMNWKARGKPVAPYRP